MIYELVIDEGKEKLIINFLKQLDFVTVTAVKKKSDKKQVKKTMKIREAIYHILIHAQIGIWR